MNVTRQADRGKARPDWQTAYGERSLRVAVFSNIHLSAPDPSPPTLTNNVPLRTDDATAES